mmetsp:Transcript_5267/g.9491  ORF Transcript_5267/g.9491 Transcript_5267/m.9491 type:complete len:782 (+) Transcript_5267:243-2588(+)
MLKNAGNGATSQQRFRELQAANSGWHKNQSRRNGMMRCLFISAFCLSLCGAILMISKLREGESSTRGVQVLSASQAAGQGFVQAGISLDNIGSIELHEPRHEVCGPRLFFVETADTFDRLTLALQRGKVTSSSKQETLQDCCSLCQEEECHGFRLQEKDCALVVFDHVDMPVMDEVVLGNTISRLRAKMGFGKDGSRAEPAEEAAQDTLVDRSVKRTASDTEDLDLELDIDVDESQEAPSQEEELVSKDDGQEFDVDVDTGADVDVDVDAENSPDDSTLEVEQESPEEDDAQISEQDTAEHEKAKEPEQEPDHEPVKEKESSLGDFGLDFGGDSAFQLPGGGLPGLEQIDHSQDELDSADQALMNKLLGNILPGAEQASDAGDGQESEEPVESTEEDANDNAFNLELGKTRLKEVIPLGDYTRLTARDQVYGKHRNVFLRYRTNKELSAVAQDMAKSFPDVEFASYGKSGDRKKPQPLMSLRVGNGRRGKHVFVVATLRGCEWTSSLAVLHTALVLKGRWESTRRLLDAMQFHFIAIANPDGFDFSHHKSPSNARSWCKSRRVAVPGYHGVDLEKNWGLDGVSWGFGKRDGAKLDSFQGPGNFSEPETRALRDYMQHYATGRGRVALLHVKCCTGIITPPLQYNRNIPDPINLPQFAALMARHVEQTDGSKYTVETPPPFGPKFTGGMIEYMHNEANVDHAYTFEVRGVGLATRADHAKISIEPFQTLLRELETATVFTALRLLQMPMEGEPVNEPFKPSEHASTVESASSSSHKRKGSRK